jgi:hypothetical protein
MEAAGRTNSRRIPEPAIDVPEHGDEAGVAPRGSTQHHAAPARMDVRPPSIADSTTGTPRPPADSAPRHGPAAHGAAANGAAMNGHPGPADGDDAIEHGATAPQLRRFIKSRAYVPMHELRRRFGINGDDDDVTPVDVDRRRVFIGLPAREGRLLGDLLRGGDIGYELSMDPITPIVVGVYPMRPVTRA